MKRVLLGLLTIGWLGCAVEESPQPTQTDLSESAEDLVSKPDTIEAPQFNQCLAGWSCVLEEQCGGPLSSRAPCGVGKFCCPPTNPQ